MDLSALSRGRAIAGALLLIAALFIAGRFVLGAGAARDGEPASSSPTGELSAEPAPRLVVHVVGAVRRPGLYRLAHGSRIADALHRAGGATKRADLSLVNLAAPLSDGTQVVVPRRAPVPAGSAEAGGEATPASGPVHLNTATVEQLDELPGVGPVTAEKIIDYREQHGAFSSVDDLDAIPGIGPARLEQLRDLVAP
jgi:competence protein ComEA